MLSAPGKFVYSRHSFSPAFDNLPWETVSASMPRLETVHPSPVPGAPSISSAAAWLSSTASDELEFFERPAGFLARLESSQFERAIQEGRGDRLYWNGSSKKRHATHKPGQVRS
jgi:hypothetical protein